jgi:hypothetical protein
LNQVKIGEEGIVNAPERFELLRELEKLAARMPDVRFGQLVANLSYAAKGATQQAIWEVQDEELLAAAKAQLSRQVQTKSSVA